MPSFRLTPLLCAAVLLTCTACAPALPSQSSGSPGESSSPAVSQPAPPEPDTEPIPPEVPAPDESSVPAIFVPSTPAQQPPDLPEKPAPEDTAPVPVPTPEPDTLPPQPPTEEDSEMLPPEGPVPEPSQLEPSPGPYDFSQPVPESAAVESDYFADAAFVGDSRSEGFYLYGVKRGKNLSSSGLSVFNLAQKKNFSCNGTRCTALEVLSANEYAKIYLGFGINELGYINADAFYQAYCDIIDAVRACQPRAVVYAQTIAPVNEGRVAATGGAGHLNNDRVRLYNDLIRKASAEKQIPLLDIYSALAVDGSLPADASRDGIHLTGDYCRKQLEYLKTHTVSFDVLYPRPNNETEVPPDEATDIPAPDPVPDTDPDSLLPESNQSPLPAGTDPAASVQ